MSDEENRVDLQSQMLHAIEENDVGAVIAVLEVHKEEKCFTNLDYDKCLLIACCHGNPSIIKALARLGHIWSTDEEGRKPIHRAVESGSVQAVQAIINSGAAVRTMDKNGLSPLHYAAKYGYCDIVRLLLLEGASARLSRAHGTNETPLHLACRIGCCHCVRLLVDRGADVNAIRSPGNDPSKEVSAWSSSGLHVAVKNGHADVVRILCDYKVNVNLVDKVKSLTPLHLAVALESTEIFELLLSHGAQVNSQASDGTTPLHHAVFSRRLACLRLLLDCQDLDILLQDCKGLTALHYAALSNAKMIEMILRTRKGVDVNAIRTATGLTCLHYAASAGNLDVVDLLLDAGHHVNVVDSTGLTPLHSAIIRAQRACEVVKRLIQAGALIDASSSHVPTPLHRFAFQFVIGRLDENILKVLTSVGAHLGPPPSTSRLQRSPICLLTRYGQFDLVRYLVESGWLVQQERSWINLQFGNASTNEILTYLRERIQQPWSLREWCRHVLRKHLSWCRKGAEISSSVDRLCLPRALKCFITLQDKEINCAEK